MLSCLRWSFLRSIYVPLPLLSWLEAYVRVSYRAELALLDPDRGIFYKDVYFSLSQSSEGLFVDPRDKSVRDGKECLLALL